MNPLVLYHANCWDGFCAAWVARKALGDIEAIPVQYGQDPPIDVCKRDVYILDFSYPRQVMRTIMSQSRFVVVLDHHKTAQKELDGLVDEFILRPDLINNIPGSEVPVIHFDMNKSGGRLAWEHFCTHPQSSWANCPVPWLVEYTEDRDLWRHELPQSRFVNAFIRSYPLTFEGWDEFDRISRGSTAWTGMLVAGEAIIRREKQIIDDHLRHAREIDMDGHKILAVNATVLFSDIAGELAKGRPFGACYFDRSDGKRQWSLRSRDDGVDVSAIAKAHGGGGHRNAAGYEEAI